MTVKPVPLTVGIFVDSVGSYGRGVISGFAGYARRAGWDLRFEPAWRFDPRRREDVGLVGLDGLLVQVTSRQSEARHLKSRVPSVNVSNFFLEPSLPTVLPDDEAVGRLAAESFLIRGYRHVGFFGAAETGFARERLKGFVEGLGTQAQLSTCDPATTPVEGWLRKLAKPSAIFACNDHFALTLLHHCGVLGIDVPSEVSVLGVDNDSLFASISKPTLSSIALPTLEIGQRAAQLLEKRMAGQDVKGTHRVAPLGIISRGSTAFMPTSDELVARVCREIAERYQRSLSVSELAERHAVSQRTLERRFRAAVGRTVLGELYRVRIEEAKRLLLAGGLPVKTVALRCGFTDVSRFSMIFRRQTGSTPTRFARLGSSI